MRLDLDFLIESVEGQLIQRGSEKTIYGVSIDSRSISPGEMFIALKGERFDGHDYIPEVLNKGAGAIILADTSKLPAEGYNATIIQVDDTLAALQKLAKRYRQLFAIPFVAVTGSVGKTTTKDILAACLSTVFKTIKTQGNFNNEIGLPLTLLNISPDHEAGVVELGMRESGEIKLLSDIVQPDYAIISNIGPVHLETMGSLENIAQAKCEVLEYITKDKFALINADNPLLLDIASKCPCKIYTFGNSDKCDIQILSVQNSGTGINVAIKIFARQESFHFPVPARTLATNIASAVGMAFLMGVSIEKIQEGLALYMPSENRLDIIKLPAGGVVINDTYNANPLSMIAALDVSQTIASGRKTVAVLGDMLELGQYEIEGHLEVGNKVAEFAVDVLVAIGDRAEYIVQGAIEHGMHPEKIRHYKSRHDCLGWLKNNVSQKDIVLFKASRGMQLDELFKDWMA